MALFALFTLLVAGAGLILLSRVFADFTSPGALTPVKHMALNLGGPGDRRDKEGRLWLGYPRAKYVSSIELPLEVKFHDGGDFQRRDSTWNRIAGTSQPWVYTSYADGLKDLQFTLRGENDGPGHYDVKLKFAAPPGDTPGARVFDIQLQGKDVQSGVDVCRQANGPDKALVLTFANIAVQDKLTLQLISRSGKRPLLCGLVIEESKP